MTSAAAPEGAPRTGYAAPGYAAPDVPTGTVRRVALLGNPNTGKTTLFNRLSGLRHKTANFPGTTLEARVGRASTGREAGGTPIDLIDMPGVYSLELDQTEAEVCRAVLAGHAAPRGERVAEPDAVCVVADATNLPRNLMFVGEVLRRRLSTVVAVNMIDLSRKQGLHIDPAKLAEDLGVGGCGVVCISARTGEGLDDLARALAAAAIPNHTPPGDEHALKTWADAIYERCASGEVAAAPRFTDHADRAFTHPVLGLLIFGAIMAGVFWLLFALAAYPMAWIEWIFAILGGGVEAVLPAGPVRELIVGGIIGGVGATVVFLPQICLLFFVISLLEDTGYLARAAFVVDRALRPFGLPGHAFVPLLSSHACALPGIMATRGIPDHRERLATILVAPFMTCSARLPVYALLTGILFPGSPGKAALAFVGCYALGIAAGVLSALIARRTILRGRSRPMALELPSYKWPSVRTALVTTYDRAMVFTKNAGTNILCICIVLWWLSSYPKVDAPWEASELRQRAAQIEASRDSQADGRDPEQLTAQADRLEAQHQAARSFAGRIGRFIQPVFEPLGYDWKLTVGVVTSFAAREVFASTMAVVVTGQEDAAQEGVLSEIAAGQRDDGSPIFTPAVAWSLLVYYVLAMQCLPTLAVTARESGSWKWAALQQVWMSGLAYVAALVVFQVMR